MGQLTEQFIRVRAKPFIVEVDQQTNKTEQNMSVKLFVRNYHHHSNTIFVSEKQIQQLKKGVCDIKTESIIRKLIV
jgi:hypothetical protein